MSSQASPELDRCRGPSHTLDGLEARASCRKLLVILPGLPVEGLGVIRQHCMVNIEIVQYLLDIP